MKHYTLEKHYTLDQLLILQEEEDHVEFKEAKNNMSFNGGDKTKPSERRKCILGYVAALCNEGGGALVLGIKEHKGRKHEVVGTQCYKGRLGKLESDVYEALDIRPDIYELYEDEATSEGRVLVIQMPPRPIGRYFCFEDVPLMRVGEDLTPMDQATISRILRELEPDFSATLCPGLTMNDLDGRALMVMKQKYATKQLNPDFLTLSDEQIMADLSLSSAGGFTYAALILLGTKAALQRYLPQAKVVLEYRDAEHSITYDWRGDYLAPFFLLIDDLWNSIDARNEKVDIHDGAYIFNISRYNEQVVREAINNAIAHRDYSTQADTFIRISPTSFVVLNSGAFPHGVTIENILFAPSTPRNRLLADILGKTGIVERSGQGVDKIFRFTISEGKARPSYARSDGFNTELYIPARIDDLAFAKFLEVEQRALAVDERLSLQEIMVLYDIAHKVPKEKLPEAVVDKLLNRKLIEKAGKTRSMHYILNETYHQLAGQSGAYVQKQWTEEMARSVIADFFNTYDRAAMKDFAQLLEPHFSRMQVRTIVDKMLDENMLLKSGESKGTTYRINPDFAALQSTHAEQLAQDFKRTLHADGRN